MKYCIIDDEPIAHRIIEGYCQNLPELQKVGNCYNAFEAIQLMRDHIVDLIFLDINMPRLTGFDLLKTLQKFPKVIVTSAHKEFALEGYEFNISDYLLKPFSLERFLKAINKVMAEHTPPLAMSDGSEKGRFFLKGDKKMHQVHYEEILFVEAFGNYTKVYLSNNKILSHEKISTLEASLPAADFLRVHKSFIVAANKINVIEGNRIKIGDHSIPIGQTYKHNLKRLYNGHSMIRICSRYMQCICTPIIQTPLF